MGQAILFPEVLLYISLNGLLMFLMVLKISDFQKFMQNWNFSSTSSSQLVLEKKSIFLSLFFKVLLVIKLILFPLLFYTTDMLSDHIHGAMCSAGVVNANGWGNGLILLSFINLIVLSFLVTIDYLDFHSKNYPFTPSKFKISYYLTQSMAIEFIFTILFFSNIELESVVQCCSTLFSSSGASLSTQLYPIEYPIYFTVLTLFSLVAEGKRFYRMSFILHLFYGAMALVSIVYLYSPYIYQLPTHRCPYCLFQKEHYYIGYPLYLLLYLSLYSGILNTFLGHFYQIEYRVFRKLSWSLKVLFWLSLNSFLLYYFFAHHSWLMPWF